MICVAVALGARQGLDARIGVIGPPQLCRRDFCVAGAIFFIRQGVGCAHWGRYIYPFELPPPPLPAARLPITNRPPITNQPPPTTNRQPLATHHQLLIANHQSPIGPLLYLVKVITYK